MRSKQSSSAVNAASTGVPVERELRMMLILAIRSAMLTYFGAVVKLPMQDRFEAGSLRDSAAFWPCCSFYAALAGQLSRTSPAMTVSRSGADHNRSAVSVQKPHRGPE